MKYACLGWLWWLPTLVWAATTQYPYTDQLDKLAEGDRWGLSERQTGTVVVPPRYDYVGWSDDPLLSTCPEATPTGCAAKAEATAFRPPSGAVLGYRQGQKWGLLTTAGEELTPAHYDLVRYARAGHAIVGVRSGDRLRLGLVTDAGRVLFKPQFQTITPNYEMTRFVVSKPMADQPGAAYFGVYDRRGEPLVRPQYTALRTATDGTYAVRDTEGQWFLRHADGTPWASEGYDAIQTFGKQGAIVARAGRWGAVEPNGAVRVPFRHESLSTTPAGTFLAKAFTRWQVIDAKTGQTRWRGEYRDLRPLSADRYAYALADGYGLLDADGNTLTEPLFDSVGPFRDGRALAWRYGRAGAIDPDGQYVLRPQYDSLRVAIGGLLVAYREGETAVFGPDGSERLAAVACEVSPYAEGRARVRQQGRYGYLDDEGKTVIAPTYEQATHFRAGRALIQKAGKWGLIGPAGQWLVAPEYDALRPLMPSANPNDTLGARREWIGRRGGQDFLLHETHGELTDGDSLLLPRPDGTVLVRRGEGVGLYNDAGRRLLPARYEAIGLRGQEGTFVVKAARGYGLADSTGAWLLPPDTRYEAMSSLSEGFLGVRMDNRWGFVDAQGRLLIANRYDDAAPFCGGMAAVRLKGKWGFIDLREILRVQPYYDEVFSYVPSETDRVARVRRGDRWALVDANGKELVAALDTLVPLATSRYLARQGDAFGLTSGAGRWLIPARYPRLSPLNDQLLVAERSGKFGAFDADGRAVVPLIFSALRYNAAAKTFVAAEPSREREIR